MKLEENQKVHPPFSAEDTFKLIRSKLYSGSRKKTNIQARARRYFRRLDTDLKDRFELSTVKYYYSQLRKLTKDSIKEEWLREMILDNYFKLSKDEYELINRSYREQVHYRELKPKKLANANILIARAISMIHSESYLDQTAGLILLTGRRPVEVIQAAFRPTKRINVAEFHGQAKTKDHLPRPYKIPLLIPFSTLNRVLAEILEKAEHLRGRSRMEIKKGMNLSRNVHEWFGETTKPYDLRHYYVAICKHLYRPESVGENAFVAKIMGHMLYTSLTEKSIKKGYTESDTIDAETAASYNTHYIEREEDIGILRDPTMYHFLTH